MGKQLALLIRSADKEDFAEQYSVMIKELILIALELKRSPTLSVVQPIHDMEQDFWRIANTPDQDVHTKVT